MTFLFVTFDNAAWTYFFLSEGAGVSYVLKMVWLDWKYWALLLLAMLVHFKKPWGFLILLMIVPGFINYFYGVYFLSNHFTDIDWYANLIAAFCAMVMIILGFIYYGRLLFKAATKTKNKHRKTPQV
jgi:hypothetical protein